MGQNNSSARGGYVATPAKEEEATPKSKDQKFVIIGAVVQLVILVGFYFSQCDFKDLHGGHGNLSSIYNLYVGMAIMMFVGFGYLMAFLQSYGLSAVGFTMFITCVGVQWAILVEGLMISSRVGALEMPVDFTALVNANYAIAAVLISFGGLGGKVSPSQVLVVTLIEILCFVANKTYFQKQYTVSPYIVDCGGTIMVHVFGAYFGLAASFVLGPAKSQDMNKPSYMSDLFSLIGTIFLWLFCPSFVAASLPPNSVQRETALLNTVLALLASTVVTFVLAPAFNDRRLKAVPIQRAVLAGGVVMGASANLAMGPFSAVLLGTLAGVVSCVCFWKPLIPSEYDTLGINSLHGIPGLFGGLASAIIPFWLVVEEQALPIQVDVTHQVIGLGITLVFAVVMGAGTGLVLRASDMIGDPAMSSPKAYFNDAAFWDCAEDIKKL